MNYLLDTLVFLWMLSDPFDHMLVAQALEEHLTLITHDRKLEPYGAKVLWT